MSSDIYRFKTHPLVGIWIGDEDDARAEYTIKQDKSNFIVTARDRYDNEEFGISNVVWDGKKLSFDSYMPSTGRRGVNVFTLLDSGEILSEYTFTDKAIFKRVE